MTTRVINANNFFEATRYNNANIKGATETAINEKINSNTEANPIKLQEAECERSKAAKMTDFLAAIPLIGSLFGLARMIGSAAVAIYYKLHERNVTQLDVMLLRAKDEFKRGFIELIPMGGMFINCVNDLENSPLILPGARGEYYCKYGSELYYSNNSFAGKQIQWIRHSDESVHEVIFLKPVALNTQVVAQKCSYFVVDQGRVINNEMDKGKPLLTYTRTQDMGFYASLTYGTRSEGQTNL